MSITETGPQRAQRRAALHGLTVGAPVRADITAPGRNRPPMSNERWEARLDGMHRALRESTPPLGRVDRLARYLLQRDVTTHVRHGSSWQPTPRQRRRLDKKAQLSSYRKLLESQRLDNPAGYALAMTDTRGPAASAVIVDEPPRVPMVHTVGRQTEYGPIEPPQPVATVRQDDPEFVPRVVAALLDPANTVAAWNEPARHRPAPLAMMQNPPERERTEMVRGFRVVDRRSEHRS